MLRNDKKVPECLVHNVYAYGIGRTPAIKDEDYLIDETKAFAEDGYRFKDLLVNIVTSPGFYKVAKPTGLAPTKLQTTAARTSIPSEINK
jgi:hypothetical protein